MSAAAIPAVALTDASVTVAKRVVTPLQAAKRAMRAAIKKELATLPAETIDMESARIAAELFAHPTFQAAKSICVFMSMEKEVQTRSILAHALSNGKHCYVPRIIDSNHMVMLRVTPDALAAAADPAAAGVNADAGAALEPNSWGILEPQLPWYWTDAATAAVCSDDPLQSAKSTADSASAPAVLETVPGILMYPATEALLAEFAAMRQRAEAATPASASSAAETGASADGAAPLEWQPFEARDIFPLTDYAGSATGAAATAASTSVPVAVPVDLVLLPGVAFDAARRRIGYGRGFYDRYLASLGAVHAVARTRRRAAVDTPSAAATTAASAGTDLGAAGAATGSAGCTEPRAPLLWGLALRAQIVSEVPADAATDVPLDAVCTPDGFL